MTFCKNVNVWVGGGGGLRLSPFLGEGALIEVGGGAGGGGNG
jgi:hypothetical protein